MSAEQQPVSALNSLPVVISCEHAGRQIPAPYARWFAEDMQVLDTHRGWDPGALTIARYLAQDLQLPLFYEQTSRLLIEMNRSLDNPALFSSYMQSLSDAEKLQLIEQYYLPYRQRVTEALQDMIGRRNKVCHLSVHTFTPVLEGEVRKTDIGLLFDPQRSSEVLICQHLRSYLSAHLPALQIDFNQPYQGTDDGFTTFLRKEFTDVAYAGIEIEVNQKHVGSEALQHICQYLSGGIRNFYATV